MTKETKSKKKSKIVYMKKNKEAGQEKREQIKSTRSKNKININK